MNTIEGVSKGTKWRDFFEFERGKCPEREGESAERLSRGGCLNTIEGMFKGTKWRD